MGPSAVVGPIPSPPPAGPTLFLPAQPHLTAKGVSRKEPTFLSCFWQLVPEQRGHWPQGETFWTLWVPYQDHLLPAPSCPLHPRRSFLTDPPLLLGWLGL